MYRDKLCRPAPGSKGRLPILLVPNPDVPRDVAPATFRTAALLRRSWSLDATTLNADWATAAWKPASLLGSWPPTGRLGTSTHPALSAPRGGAGRGGEGALGGQGLGQRSPHPQGQDPGRPLPPRPRPWDPRQDMGTPWARGTHFLPLPEATPKRDSEREAEFKRSPWVELRVPLALPLLAAK